MSIFSKPLMYIFFPFRNLIFFIKNPGNDLLFHALRQSTIGANSFHLRVRNGIGCLSIAMVTRKPLVQNFSLYDIVIKPIELLVLVSFMHYCTSTSNLSTWWSSTTLMGKSSIQVGFPLRCFQRLSCPYIATQRCSWRNNWYTSGTFIPVLSY